MKDYTAGKPWKIAKQKRILEAAYRLFSEKGIEQVSMPEIAAASGIGRATVFRYFSTKLELVISIGTWKWEEYISDSKASALEEDASVRTAADCLRVSLDSFLDLYRNHPDILRFNYDFNSYLRHEADTEEQKQPYMGMVDDLADQFHQIYALGERDGTLNTEISEKVMFSSLFHIMLAAVTRYAVGLVYMPEGGADPEKELVMLGDMLFSRFTRTA